MKYFKETIKLLENSSFYYTVAIDMDNRYNYISSNYNRNFDFLDEPLLGKSFHTTLHPDDIHIYDEVVKKCFQNPDKLFAATLRKRNGQNGYIVTRWNFKALFDGNNKPDGIFCIGHNITNSDINTNNKRVSAQAEIDNKSVKGRMSILQSYNLRKPLANIIGLANILSDMEVDTDLHSINDMMVQSVNELDDAIKNIRNK